MPTTNYQILGLLYETSGQRGDKIARKIRANDLDVYRCLYNLLDHELCSKKFSKKEGFQFYLTPAGKEALNLSEDFVNSLEQKETNPGNEKELQDEKELARRAHNAKLCHSNERASWMQRDNRECGVQPVDRPVSGNGGGSIGPGQCGNDDMRRDENSAFYGSGDLATDSRS